MMLPFYKFVLFGNEDKGLSGFCKRKAEVPGNKILMNDKFLVNYMQNLISLNSR